MHSAGTPARHATRGQDGFTLVELLVVISVLSILAAVVIYNVVQIRGRGSSAACLTDQETVQTAVDAYFYDRVPHVYPVTAGDTASPSTSDTVNVSELTAGSKSYIHTAPAETFTYTGTGDNISGGC